MTKQTPDLPTELWIRVLESHRTPETLPELWNRIRHVSTRFKEAVESIFRDHLLPTTYITFKLGETWDDETDRIILGGTFDYSHLSEDKRTAVFKLEPGNEKYHNLIRSRLQEALDNMDFEEPQHTIQVRGELTDGPIPKLSLDYESFQLSCNWLDLYSAFWGEIELTHKLDGDWVLNQESWLGGLRDKMERGELNIEATMMQALTGFASSNSDNLKKARRARIKHQYKECDGFDWDENNEDYVREEPRILKALARERKLVSMEEFSDDEMEDDDDDGDDNDKSEEEDEEDEWEDEEGDDEDEKMDDTHIAEI